MRALTAPISNAGWTIVTTIVAFGQFARFSLDAVHSLLLHPGRWLRWRLLSPQLFNVGVRSIPVVGITGAFIGMVLALESYDQFASIGQESRLGGVISVSVTRQIGPVLAAVMVAGRVGGALAAELGTMRVTEQ
ncbi:MAG: ABC transporter permease, partial [Planctomycetota bacterium]